MQLDLVGPTNFKLLIVDTSERKLLKEDRGQNTKGKRKLPNYRLQTNAGKIPPEEEISRIPLKDDSFQNTEGRQQLPEYGWINTVSGVLLEEDS